jgi:hypothetical protein
MKLDSVALHYPRRPSTQQSFSGILEVRLVSSR